MTRLVATGRSPATGRTPAGARLAASGRVPEWMLNPLVTIPALAAYWASDPSQTPPAEGGSVTTWRDGSGNNRTLSQGGGAATPTYTATSTRLGNRPAMRFNGTNQTVENTAVSKTTPHSLVAVIAPIAFAAGARWVGLNTAATNRGYGWTNAPKWQPNFPTTGSSTSTPLADTPYLVVWTSATGILNINGTDDATTFTITSTINQVVLGGGRAAAPTYAAFANLDIGFLGIYPGSVTSHANWGAFKTWAGKYYGMTVV